MQWVTHLFQKEKRNKKKVILLNQILRSAAHVPLFFIIVRFLQKNLEQSVAAIASTVQGGCAGLDSTLGGRVFARGGR